MVDTGVVRGIGVAVFTGAATQGVTDEAMRAEATGAAMPVTMAAGTTHEAMPGVVDSMAEAPFAAVVATTAEVDLEVAVPTVAADPEVAAASTVAVDPTVVDTGNGLLHLRRDNGWQHCAASHFSMAHPKAPNPDLT